MFVYNERQLGIGSLDRVSNHNNRLAIIATSLLSPRVP